jgi:hypothetical protein
MTGSAGLKEDWITGWKQSDASTIRTVKPAF